MPEVDDKLFERIFEIQRADSESEVKVPITWLVYGLSNLYSISSPEWIYHIKRTAEAAENSFVRYPTFTDIILDSPPNIPEKSSPDLASKSLDDQTPAEVLAGAMIAAYVSISDGDYLFARDTISDARSAIDGKKEEYPTEEVKSALAVADFVKSELFLRMEGDQNLQISFNSINDSVDILPDNYFIKTQLAKVLITSVEEETNLNTSIGINNNWGTLLDRAESLLTEVAEIAPDFSEAYFWRGRIFANQSDYSGAVSLFERAIDKLDHDREHYNSKYIEYQQFLLEVKVQQQSKNIEQRYNELEKGAEKVENTLEDVESRVDHVQSAIDEYRGQILQFLGFFTAIIH